MTFFEITNIILDYISIACVIRLSMVNSRLKNLFFYNIPIGYLLSKNLDGSNFDFKNVCNLEELAEFIKLFRLCLECGKEIRLPFPLCNNCISDECGYSHMMQWEEIIQVMLRRFDGFLPKKRILNELKQRTKRFCPYSSSPLYFKRQVLKLVEFS